LFDETQKEKLDKFLCKNTKTYIHEEKLDDSIGIQAYSIETFFDFECRVMPWTNDKIRINYLNGVGGLRNIGKKIDTRDYDYQKPTIDQIDKYVESENLRFSLVSGFKSELLVNFSPILDGLSTFIVMTTTSIKDPDAYNGFFFTKSTLWDDYWFDERTRMLLFTEPYVLGSQQLELGQIIAQPEINIHLKRIEKRKVLGFTVSYDDLVDE
jgi:hypothetical protein